MTEEFELRFLSARRNYIAGQFSELNDMQQQAVLTTEGPLLLLAGAGSGKTTVLINRIANLLRFGSGSDSHEIPDIITEDDVLFLESLTAPISEYDQRRADYLCAVRPPAPWSVIAITFTNKAANELKNRLAAMLGPQAQDVWAMTFHSACCRILREHIYRLGYTSKFTIYDRDDSERVVKSIIRNMGFEDKDLSSKYVLNVISKEKCKLNSANKLLDSAANDHDLKHLTIARVYKKYDDYLKESNALDFDDIIIKTVELLQQNKDIRDYYHRKFRYILVDEYQDTNYLQYLLISLLVGDHHNICVVGDDDQSIYRFRGATIDNILDFEKQYKSACLIKLEQNYRSTQAILNSANSVIAHNYRRKGKRLWTANGYGNPVTICELDNEQAEAEYVANQIVKFSHGKNFRNFAVLYRTNAQAREIEKALKLANKYNIKGIPYRIVGGTRFYDRAEIKDMLAYLCVINNPYDDLRLKRIINNPPRGLGEKTLQPAYRQAEAEKRHLYEILVDSEAYAPLQKNTDKFLKFTSMIEHFKSLLASGVSLGDFYEYLLADSGYVEMLEKKNTDDSRGRLEHIRELKSSIIAYEQNAETPSLSGFLEEVALYTDIEEYNEDDDAVVLMTMHASKGMEFPNVFLTGFEEQLFPAASAYNEEDGIEEERRLCYVAITRAKENLTISYARQRMLYGHTNAAMPSRFIKELPAGDIERKGGYSTPSRFASYSTPDYGNYKPAAAKPSYTPAPPKPVAMIALSKGDMVQHAAFGRGLVLSVMNMGSDALLEIAFDQIGTKKLLAKAATPHMKKL